MRTILLAFGVLLFPTFAWAFNPVQNDRSYQAWLDLTTIQDQRIQVNVVVPVLEDETVIYNMPKIVPGTYKIYDFGQFVHNFKAYDSKGNELPVQKLNANQWQISNAPDLYKIAYWASASFDDKRSGIFAPAGTAIGKEAFLLNNFGFIGYLQGYKHMPYTLTVAKPEDLYGTTSLAASKHTAAQDEFVADDYFELHDCPILYAKPDTASLRVAGMPVYIGVYSPGGNITAKRLAASLGDVFTAAADYLGGSLPAEQYTIIVYGVDIRMAMSGTGALEHHTSTVLTMPDVEEKMLAMFSGGDPMQIYRDIVAHEFFHIVTPLNIHSQQINDYDFINPQMSEHLWLYEGVTEYNSMIAQARAGIINLEEFIELVEEKMEMAHQYNEDLPFTQTSKYALSFFGNQYNNVYLKGALIGMAADLKLRQLSDGKYGLINLLQDLWQTYGQDTFFVDDELFGIIATTSGYPQMEEFFARHVAGAQPLPFEDLLKTVGISYQEEVITKKVSNGGIKMLRAKEKDGMTITAFDANSSFVKQLGLARYDILTKWNGIPVTKENGKEIIANWSESAKDGDMVEIEVYREVRTGKFKKLKLKAIAQTEQVVKEDVFTINTDISEKQRYLRQIWINQ
jgi:predicted metalloprotease with PDZ domain